MVISTNDAARTQCLLARVAQIEALIAFTTQLRRILDNEWFSSIRSTTLSSTRPRLVDIDPTGLLDDLHYDRSFVLTLESRLAAFAALPFKRDVVAKKLDQLRSSRTQPQLRNHLLEISALGKLAALGVLVDIGDEASGVDGVIQIEARPILFEVTNSTMVQAKLEPGISPINVICQEEHVAEKIKAKVTGTKQIAKANGSPAVLLLALREFGILREVAECAVEASFNSPEFSKLSGVVLADTWHCRCTSWHPATAASTALSPAESLHLMRWFGQGGERPV